VKILVLNCGSSSLKYQLIDMDSHAVLCSGLAERIGDPKGQITHKTYPGTDKAQSLSLEEHFPDHTAALGHCAKLITEGQAAVAAPAAIGAIGQRVVHGGEAFRQPTIINADVIATITKYCSLAPLHNPAGLMGIAAATALFPGVPQVAVFDTAFHGTIPDHAYLFPIPYSLYEELGVRRYGFHGTSHSYIAKKTAETLRKPLTETRCITIHLGNGCSMAAVQNGRSIDTSMGLTPLMGLMMGTRCGDVDPSLHSFLAANKNLSLTEVDALLNKQSGLKGVCGRSDMRDVHAAIAAGDAKAALALRMFCYRVKHYIGAYLAALGGCDAIVFTAGIGENDPAIRQMSCDTLGPLGIILDNDRNINAARGAIVKISSDNSPIAVYVIPTNEELEIALQAYSLVGK